MRQLRAVSAPHSIHTGGKSEAQLTKKQAVMLMHDIYFNVLFNCLGLAFFHFRIAQIYSGTSSLSHTSYSFTW